MLNAVTVPAGDGRAHEALARYGLRNPVSLARLRWTPGSPTATYLPRASHDDERAETFEAMDFVARLLAHVPDARRHLVHYYGAYSNVVRGKLKARAQAETQATEPFASEPGAGSSQPSPPPSPSAAALRRSWARLLLRVYETDPLVCPRCRAVMRVPTTQAEKETMGAGERPGLIRDLGAWDATAIMVSNMIGVGILTFPGIVALALGDIRLALVLLFGISAVHAAGLRQSRRSQGGLVLAKLGILGLLVVGGLMVTPRAAGTGSLPPGPSPVVAALIVLFVFAGSANAMIVTGPRIYYSMALDGLFPRALGAVSEGGRVPARALWLQTLWTAAILVGGAALTPEHEGVGRTFETIVDWTAFAIFPFAALTTASVFVLRRRERGPQGGFRVPLYPWTPLLFILAAVGVELGFVAVGLRPANAVIGGALVLSGLPAFVFWRCRPSR